ncbi:RFX DNA-binding domain-containing protein [Gongronella butleri]|nr:RFX DNA-binding domain-containing protein [Gongronella butleri]
MMVRTPRKQTLGTRSGGSSRSARPSNKDNAALANRGTTIAMRTSPAQQQVLDASVSVDRAGTNHVVSWLLANYETKPNSNVPRSGIYTHYKRDCSQHGVQPVNSASFGKLLRTVFSSVVTRRLGVRGQSKYQYCNITRRVAPDFQQHQFTPDTPPDSNASQTSTIVPSSSSSTLRGDSSAAASATQVSSAASTAFPMPPLPSLSTPSSTLPSNSSAAPSTPASITSSTRLPPPPASFTTSMSSSSLSNVGFGVFTPGFPGNPGRYPPLPAIVAPNFHYDQNDRHDDLAAVEKNDAIRQFTHIYDQHSHEIYNHVFNGNFDQLNSLYREFYGHTIQRFIPLLETSPALVDSIWRWDCMLYDSLIVGLLPRIDTPLDEAIVTGLHRYMKNLPGYIEFLLAAYPEQMRKTKTDNAKMFVVKLRSQLSINKYASVLAGILQQPAVVDEMHTEWEKLDIDAIISHALWVCDCRDEDIIPILKRDVNHLLLLPECKVDAWMDLVYKLMDKFIVTPRSFKVHDIDQYLIHTKQFVMKWKTYTSVIIQHLTIHHTKHLEHFKSLQFFLDDFVLYAAEERITAVNVNSNKNMMLPDLPPATTPFSAGTVLTPTESYSTPSQ